MSGTKVVHRFIRNANIDSNIYNRVANRYNPFTNTLVTLKDPETDRTLTLIGTTNSSTTLAHRTKVLLDQLKPDAVYTQTSQMWWDHAKHTNVPIIISRLTTRNYSTRWVRLSLSHSLSSWIICEEFFSAWDTTFGRQLLRAAWVSFILVSGLSDDFNLFTPGLETFYTCKYAADNKIPTYFGGVEFDPVTIRALRLQPDLYPHTMLWRGIRKTYKLCSSWTTQYDDFMNTLHVRGGEAFAESVDRSRINFIVGLISKAAPKQKNILVDQRD